MIAIFVVFLLIFAAFLWGTAPVLEKIALSGMEAETYYLILAIPMFLAWIIFMIINRKKVLYDIRHNNALNWKNFLLIGMIVIIFGALPQLIYLKMIKRHPAAAVAALTSIFPIFTFFIAKIILKEKMTWEELLGVILVTLGVVTIVLKTPDLTRTA